MNPDEKAVFSTALEVLEDGKAVDPILLDLRELTTMADYFLIAHGNNTKQVQALAGSLEEKLKGRLGLSPHHIEGMAAAQWILMDYGFFLVHLFLEAKREYYGLERIWMDAPKVVP